MKNFLFLSFLMLIHYNQTQGQSIARQFNGLDCNNKNVDLFSDLDSGKAVVLFYFMANCSSCPPEAKKIQEMTNKINASFPGLVKGYAFPYSNSTTCTYAASWVSSNNLTALFQPMDSGASDVTYYGGFGMPSVVLLGGKDHKVMFFSKNFTTSDTSKMRDSILTLTKKSTASNKVLLTNTNVQLYPNPTSDQFTIKINLSDITTYEISITDFMGKQYYHVFKQNASTGIQEQEINTSYLAPGNYLVSYKIDGHQITNKLNIVR